MSQYGYTQLFASQPTAVKKHRCTWCGEPILPKEKYEYQTGHHYGEFQVTKLHLECLDALNKEAKEEGGNFEYAPYENERPSK